MSRNPARFRRLTWLALVATLLLSVMPTVSRILMATVPQAAPLLMEMCTTGGRQLVDVSAFSAGGESPAAPATMMDEACGYCVLATPLPLVLLLFCLLALRPPAAPRERRYAAPRPCARNLRGLGSQAPPLVL